MPLEQDIRDAMTGGLALTIEFADGMNDLGTGNRQVYLTAIPGGVRISPNAPGEQVTILWLPWRQGEMYQLRAETIEAAPNGRLFFTYYMTGCKLFAIRGGPVWHIDAQIPVAQFWPRICDEEWVKDNWQAGTAMPVAYLHRAGQGPALWDLSAFLEGDPPTTYGAANVGQAIVGGIVTDGVIDYYYQSSPWAPLKYAFEKRLK
ncbi:MAG TPA: BLF1 family deaminating toxin [Rhizomicrobium sp.]|nr:BLF1 family deaminating toxin [Rhizomicrobium sp.]